MLHRRNPLQICHPHADCGHQPLACGGHGVHGAEPQLTTTVGKSGRIRIKADQFKFQEGSAEIEKGVLALKVGDALVEVLGNPVTSKNIRFVLIEGHTSASGEPPLNRKLSAERARNMVQEWAANYRDYFRDETVPIWGVTGNACVGAKIMFGGFGESRPVDGCNTLDYDTNRRLEIEIVAKPTSERDILTCP